MLCWTGASHALPITNPDWEAPTDLVNSTNTTATGWTMIASGEPLQAGDRAAFYNNTPGGRWSYWLRDFEDHGSATQIVTGTTPGTNYAFTAQMLFELGSGSTVGATSGYNDVPTMNSFLEMQFENGSGTAVGLPYIFLIPSGSVPLSGNRTWNPYTAAGIAPAGSSQVLLEIGWFGGNGTAHGTGSQSAFADDVTLGVAVPEPASLSVMGLGALTLLVRRRK
jgi:hypothetical protein